MCALCVRCVCVCVVKVDGQLQHALCIQMDELLVNCAWATHTHG